MFAQLSNCYSSMIRKTLGTVRINLEIPNDWYDRNKKVLFTREFMMLITWSRSPLSQAYTPSMNNQIIDSIIDSIPFHVAFTFRCNS